VKLQVFIICHSFIPQKQHTLDSLVQRENEENIKSTTNFGLMLKKSSSFQLLAYTDADWGGNLDDRTSTSAYLIFFGGNPIS
jgi:hypothetical protein